MAAEGIYVVLLVIDLVDCDRWRTRQSRPQEEVGCLFGVTIALIGIGGK